MSLPLYIFFIPYLLFLLTWITFSVIAVYHMFKFGFKNFTTFFTTFIYISISALMLFASLTFINAIDWGVEITVFGNLFNSEIQFFGF